VDGDAAARLAQEQAAERVVALERLHLLEHCRPSGRQHAANDDVADLAARVAADDGESASSAHPPRPYRARLASLPS
jgi:hypothetical protein